MRPVRFILDSCVCRYQDACVPWNAMPGETLTCTEENGENSSVPLFIHFLILFLGQFSRLGDQPLSVLANGLKTPDILSRTQNIFGITIVYSRRKEWCTT